MVGKRSLSIDGVRLIFNDGEIGIMLRSVDGEVGRDVQRRAYAVQKRMKRLAPVGKTSQLRNGIHVESLSETPDGPASRVVSDAPHTLVNELGRGPVRASGSYNNAANLRRRGKGASLSSSDLTWGSDRSGDRPKMLIFEGKRGGLVVKRDVAAAKGSHFMERSIDAALD